VYKIISITNYHQFDGIELTQKDFIKLIEVLEMGTFYFTAEVLHDGKKEIHSNLSRWVFFAKPHCPWQMIDLVI